MDARLSELLYQSTVKILDPRRNGHGTGFFIAPNLVLTCAHVVHQQELSPYNIESPSSKAVMKARVRNLFANCDMTLLEVEDATVNAPVVFLDQEILTEDGLYTFGYPDIDFPNGCPVTFKCEGITPDYPPFIKFKDGQVRPGMSGSPLLNLRTNKVCGVVKFTRDRSSNLGGGAIHIAVLFDQFPELLDLQQHYHENKSRWTIFVDMKEGFWGARGDKFPISTQVLIRQLGLKKDSNLPFVENEVRRIQIAGELGRRGDPRIQPAHAAYWCMVPQGTFVLGSESFDMHARRTEKPQRYVQLAKFYIARFPVTNIQWQEFVHDNGYQDDFWWSEEGWEKKEYLDWTKPMYWNDNRFNGPNQPVVGISWYESIAFCKWYGARMGLELYLPSEAQWEKAARGEDGRNYSWGNEYDGSQLNVEGRIGMTTPVGCYPLAASPYGCLDMCGNISEWTATPWLSTYQYHDGTMHEWNDVTAVAYRGGSWKHHHAAARCSFRNWLRPEDRNDFVGLRLVRK